MGPEKSFSLGLGQRKVPFLLWRRCVYQWLHLGEYFRLSYESLGGWRASPSFYSVNLNSEMTLRGCWDDSRLVISSHVPLLGGQAAIFLGFSLGCRKSKLLPFKSRSDSVSCLHLRLYKAVATLFRFTCAKPCYCFFLPHASLQLSHCVGFGTWYSG